MNCTTVAFVTGSANGFGRAAARALGRLGATGVVDGRDRAATECLWNRSAEILGVETPLADGIPDPTATGTSQSRH